MVRYQKRIQNRKYTQTSLEDFKNSDIGQPLHYKLLLFTLSIFFSSVVGALSGVIAGPTALMLYVPEAIDVPNVRVIISAACCTAIVWMVGTVWTTPAKGLQNSFLTVLISIVVLLLAFRVTAKNVNTFLFFAFLYLAFALLCLLISTLALTLTFSLLGKNQSYRTLQKSLIITISIAFAVFEIKLEDWVPYYPSPTIFLWIKLLGVLLFDSLLISASSRVSHLAIQGSENFKAIRQWAVAISSWGGTSFHNLDLSGTDFLGSRLANTDLRAKKLYRTCFQDVTGLERARVDNHYLDLDNPKVQRLLTKGNSQDKDFNQVNLRGAYLKKATMVGFQLVDANLDEADLREANLSHSLLVRTSIRDADLTGAELTGVCIEDWTFNSHTVFTDVKCDYVYRKLSPNSLPTEKYPADRNFAVGEFAMLCQKISNAAEFVFSGQFNQAALESALEKLRLEENELGLELIGIEPQKDTWVIKVAHKSGISSQQVQQQVLAKYEEEIYWLRGLVAGQLADARETASRPIVSNTYSNTFNITDSQVHSLVGSGEIYNAVQQIPKIMATGRTVNQMIMELQKLLEQIPTQFSGNSLNSQTELLQKLILEVAQTSSEFQEFLVQEGQQIVAQMPSGVIATAIESVISQLS